MKGDTQIPWIIVIIVLSLIVLFVLGTMVVSGKKTAEGQFTQTDLWACCDNCWAANPNGVTSSTVICSISGETTIELQDLCKDVLGKECENCADISPFCRGSN